MVDTIDKFHVRWDFVGLSTDEKPTPETNENVVSGSTFYCSDTSKLYVWYDNNWWERLPVGTTYTLPTASHNRLGGIKVGDNLSIDADGVLSTDAGHVDVDTEMSSTSENAVQNKVIKDYVDNGLNDKADKATTYTKTETDALLDDKQDTLVSGTNIKTINSESLVGSGNIDIENKAFVVAPYHTTYEEIKQAILDERPILIDNKYIATNQAVDAFGALIEGFLEHTFKSYYVTPQEVWTVEEYYLPSDTEVGYLITNKTGDLTNLTTDNKTNLVSAINEIVSGGAVDEATDTTSGTIKTDSSKNITLNADGQLEVGGRLGQTEEGGLYSPISMNPTLVDKNALLLSGMSGLSVGNGSLALLRGGGVTVKPSPAGTTEYHVANTYANRFICAGLQRTGAVCIINEDAEPSGEFSNILSCTINGASFVPDSGADDPNNDIVIIVDKTANPDTTITNLRCYLPATKSSSFYAGQEVGAFSGLANVVVGQNTFSDSGNVVAMIAQQSYNTGNGVGLFGRYLNSRKNRWFMSGTGHDNTNGRAESGAVVGQYSVINPDTLFAVGNGTDQLNRSNAFEVTDSGVSLPKVNNLEIVDVNLAPAFNTTNYSKTSAITITGDTATFPDNATALYLTKKSPAIPVTAGETLEWSYEVRKTTDTVVCNQGLNLMKTNATGGSATDNIVRNEPASSYTTSWQTVKGTFTVPAGMEYMTPRLQKTMPSGGTATSGAYEVRNLKITRPGQANLVMSSPNGTRYKIVVDDSGNLSTEQVV